MLETRCSSVIAKAEVVEVAELLGGAIAEVVELFGGAVAAVVSGGVVVALGAAVVHEKAIAPKASGSHRRDLVISKYYQLSGWAHSRSPLSTPFRCLPAEVPGEFEEHLDVALTDAFIGIGLDQQGGCRSCLCPPVLIVAKLVIDPSRCSLANKRGHIVQFR